MVIQNIDGESITVLEEKILCLSVGIHFTGVCPNNKGTDSLIKVKERTLITHIRKYGNVSFTTEVTESTEKRNFTV